MYLEGTDDKHVMCFVHDRIPGAQDRKCPRPGPASIGCGQDRKWGEAQGLPLCHVLAQGGAAEGLSGSLVAHVLHADEPQTLRGAFYHDS